MYYSMNETWQASVVLYAAASAWGLASVLAEALLLHRLTKAGARHVSSRRLSVRVLILMQAAARLVWFTLGLASGGGTEQRHTKVSCLLDVAAWAFQFGALALISHYLADVLHVNETGVANYVRFTSRRRRVYRCSTLVALITVAGVTVAAFARAKDAYFIANCMSLVLCAVMCRLTLLLHRRVPAQKLAVLSGSCFFAFALTVGNGVYIRASHGAYMSPSINSIVYPWFIYQVLKVTSCPLNPPVLTYTQ
jgi:hypothetical protein